RRGRLLVGERQIKKARLAGLVQLRPAASSECTAQRGERCPRAFRQRVAIACIKEWKRQRFSVIATNGEHSVELVHLCFALQLRCDRAVRLNVFRTGSDRASLVPLWETRI